MLTTIHTIFGFISLIFGALVLFKPKGTAVHRLLGKLYIISMLALIFTSFGLFELFGGFGIFHFASLVSLFTIIMGYRAVMFRRHTEDWMVEHFIYMAWSYLGLLGATSNEIYANINFFENLMHQYFWLPILTLAVLFGFGSRIINRHAAELKKQLPNPEQINYELD